MINKLSLRNVKTHKATELEFSKGINVVTGDSGHGKTNILLALNWIINNRPLGESIIRRGQDNCESTLTIDRGGEEYSVIRKRGKNENTYVLEKESVCMGGPFTSFGTNPPESVSELLNLSDINIQKQLQPYFLVLDPPGQVATYVRSLIKLDEIDKVVKLLTKKVNTKKAELANFQRDLELVENELKELSKIDLEGLERMILEAKRTIETIQDIEKKKSELESILRELKTLEAQQITLPDDIDQRLDKVDGYCNSFVKLSEKINGLKSLTNELKGIEECEIVLPDDIDNVLSAVETTEKKYSDTYDKIEVLLGITEQIQDVGFEIDEIDEQLVELQKEESGLMEQLKSCPYCGEELNQKSRACLLGGTKENSFR